MQELSYLILGSIIVGLMSWLLYQRRRIEQYREMCDRVRKEKEAVISLMDNIGDRITSKIELDSTLEVIAQYVVEETRAESAAIFLIDERDNTLQARTVVGLFPPLFEDEEFAEGKHKYLAEKIRKHRIKVGEGIIGLVARQDKPLLITDAEADPRVPRSASSFLPVHSLVLCPLRVRGRNLGVIVIVNKQGEEIFDSRDTFLLQALADQAAVTVDLVKLYDVLQKQQRFEQELNIAHEFQRMLLPRELPKVEGYDFGACNESAMVVGGDFYDFFRVDQGHLGIVIGDVSGKGVPGALIMAMVQSILRAEASDTLSPKEALRRVNRRVLTDTKENVFVTITYGILDLANRRFRFVRAGHEPVLIRQGEENGAQISVVRPEGMAVGLMSNEIFDNIEEMEVQLQPGDAVLLYTDGVVEAVNGAAAEYGRSRLIRFFAGHANCPAERLVKAVTGDIHDFAHGIPQQDDITLVAFRVKEKVEGEDSAAQDKRESRSETSALQTA